MCITNRFTMVCNCERRSVRLYMCITNRFIMVCNCERRSALISHVSSKSMTRIRDQSSRSGYNLNQQYPSSAKRKVIAQFCGHKIFMPYQSLQEIDTFMNDHAHTPFNYSCLWQRLSQGNALNSSHPVLPYLPVIDHELYISSGYATTRAMHTTEAVVRKFHFAVVTSSLLL